MPCLFVMFAAFAPRLLLVFMWIARPNLMGQAFDTFIIPLLGFIFLPFTTLMWVLLWAGSGGSVTGFDWVWIGIAVLLDLGHYAGGAANRRGMPGSGSSPAVATAPTMSSTSGAPMSAPVTPPATSPVPTPEAPAPPAPAADAGPPDGGTTPGA